MKKILTICKNNISRSQMAKAFFKKYSDGDINSAGTSVGEENGESLTRYELLNEAMNEVGIDISQNIRTQLTKDLSDRADVVICLTEKSLLPDYVDLNKVVFRDTQDAGVNDIYLFRRIRDKIEGLVKELSLELLI